MPVKRIRPKRLVQPKQAKIAELRDMINNKVIMKEIERNTQAWLDGKVKPLSQVIDADGDLIPDF